MTLRHNSQNRLIGRTEEERQRYSYLIWKFFEGETLWERTKLENKHGLVGLCMGSCSTVIHDDSFCVASSHDRDVECPYAGERVKGGNPFHRCNYFKELQREEGKCINPEYFRNVRTA